jgi:hypothetical protein
MTRPLSVLISVVTVMPDDSGTTVSSIARAHAASDSVTGKTKVCGPAGAIHQRLGGYDAHPGAAPAYAYFCVFGMLMWARCVSKIEPLEADDPVFFWRERLLDLFDGLGRRAPSHCG